MCDHPFENSIAISQLLPQLISSVRPHSSQADCINPTLQPSSPDRNILLFPSETAKSPRAERKPTCFLSAGQSKCEAAGCKLGRLHCCCRVAATATSRSRLCWLRNNNYFPFASLRGNNALFLRRWLSAATQLFPDKLVHFQGKYPNFTKFVLCMVLWIEPPVCVVYGSMDRTTSEESWLHQKDPNGVLWHPGIDLDPMTPKSLC